jgi:hypothetical protein
MGKLVSMTSTSSYQLMLSMHDALASGTRINKKVLQVNIVSNRPAASVLDVMHQPNNLFIDFGYCAVHRLGDI